MNGRFGVFRNVDEIRKPSISCETGRVDIQPFVTVIAYNVCECSIVATPFYRRVEFVTEIGARESDGTSGVLLLDAAEQVRCIADLSFDFLLAVSEIVVCNQRDDDAFRSSGGQLERSSVVVKLVL